jgi:four helix bundle protein
MIRSYKDLEIWRRGVELVRNIYLVTRGFPKSETHALVDQIRRAALSIPSNIAEGHTRQHRKEFRQFLFIAFGSLAELETQLIVAAELGFLRKDKLNQLLSETDVVGKMTRALIKRLQAK